jgi:hypothetical protein
MMQRYKQTPEYKDQNQKMRTIYNPSKEVKSNEAVKTKDKLTRKKAKARLSLESEVWLFLQKGGIAGFHICSSRTCMCHLIRQDEILLFPGSCQVKYSEASQ